MEAPNEELSIAELCGLRKQKKKTTTKKKTLSSETVAVEAENPTKAIEDGSDGRVNVSLFDYSIENFFRDMDTIAKLCGEEDDINTDHSEIQRLYSSVTFLREWKHFKYEGKSIRFTSGLGSPEGKDVIGSVNLPQFSSASVPKKVGQVGEVKFQKSRKDFVMYAGGSVWALDWCPQIHEKPDCSVKCEFLAIAAHPPGASYHKMGAPLIGRGVIQIWCVVNDTEDIEELPPPTKKKKGGSNKDGIAIEKSSQMKRPRGRPRKDPIEAVVDMNCKIKHVQALTVQFPENSVEFQAPDGILENNDEVSLPSEKRKRGPIKQGAIIENSTQIKRPRGRPRKNQTKAAVAEMNCETQDVQALAVQFPVNSAEFLALDGVPENNEGISLPIEEKSRGCEKNEATNYKSSQRKTSTGRARKIPKEVALDNLNCEGQYVQDLAVQCPENSAVFSPPHGSLGNCPEYALQQHSDTNQKHTDKVVSMCNPLPMSSVQRSRRKTKPMNGKFDNDRNMLLLTNFEDDINDQPSSSDVGSLAAASVTEDVPLPRIVSCLAHNGKVAWDVKWRPPKISGDICKHRMGYLAVLLGSGSLEVWDVPLPHALRAIYLQGDSTDPRFIKLEPVFKCSMLKRGGLQSIPLTVEWSTSPHDDYLLAGCHDGTVALWKFSTNALSKCEDTKPLLCFRADIVPIRAVAWASLESFPESSNLVLTAGHGGLKFWDLRDPFRPLSELRPVPKAIYSLNWLSNPSCIIMSFEDGTMRTLSLAKYANDFPVTGVRMTKQQGLHSCLYPSFAIWSVHVSRKTGMAAYCGADGTALRFQLMTKALESGHSRTRAHHFLCGSITEEESILTVNTPVPKTPFPLKNPLDKGQHALSSTLDLSEPTPSKCTNDQMVIASNSDSQTLAICDGDNMGSESGAEEGLVSPEGLKKPKSSRKNKKKLADGQSLACKDDENTNTLEGNKENSDCGMIYEAFPPKMVALHRIRWNMNKGSERWLCYGGAGGIVRCQEIVFSDFDKKLASKR